MDEGFCCSLNFFALLRTRSMSGSNKRGSSLAASRAFHYVIAFTNSATIGTSMPILQNSFAIPRTYPPFRNDPITFGRRISNLGGVKLHSYR
jgi:hypothetical protein